MPCSLSGSKDGNADDADATDKTLINENLYNPPNQRSNPMGTRMARMRLINADSLPKNRDYPPHLSNPRSQFNLNVLPYGNWRFAESVRIPRVKSKKQITMANFTTFPALC